MSTLHQHHWHTRSALTAHLGIIGTGDSLVIYGEPNEADYQWLLDNEDLNHISWHLVNQAECPHMQRQLISHHQWLELIIRHNNTYVWKS